MIKSVCGKCRKMYITKGKINSCLCGSTNLSVHKNKRVPKGEVFRNHISISEMAKVLDGTRTL